MTHAQSSHQIASLAEAEAFFAAHPDVDAVDIIFTNIFENILVKLDINIDF